MTAVTDILNEVKDTTDTSQETPDTNTTDTPTEAFDLQAYADSGEDAFVSRVYPQIKAGIDALTAQAEEMRKFTPPSVADIYKYINGDDVTDPLLIKATAKIAELRATIEELDKARVEKAKEILVPDALPQEELDKARTEFNKQRDLVKHMVRSVASYAELSGQEDLEKAFEDLSIPQFVRGLGTSGDTERPVTEVGKVRQWLKDQGETVTEKGRIPAALQAKYDEAHKGE